MSAVAFGQERRRAVAAIASALMAEAEHRREHDDWIERERIAVAVAANEQAAAHGWRMITVADVERVEPRAMGHIDYVTKLALYVAELTWVDLGEPT